jgi:RHS repeat-associated protein
LTSKYLYDGNGVRVSKTEQGADTQIVLNPIYREIVDPSAPSSSPGALARFEALYSSVARRVLSRAVASDPLTTASDDLVWLSTDHLGGAYFLTNLQGTEIAGSRAYYRPFGGYVQAAPSAEGKSGHRQFTSKERDATGLYDFSARLYDPATGRFVQADDIDLGPNTQAFNRYSYVLNNPLRMIDPTGHQALPSELTTFQADPVAGFNEVALLPSDPSEWAPYQPTMGGVTLPDTSPPPLITQMGHHVCCPKNYAEFLEMRWRLEYEGTADTLGAHEQNAKLELQKFGMETMWEKNAGGFEGSAQALGVLYGGAFGGSEALTAQATGNLRNAVFMDRARAARNALANSLKPMKSNAPAAVTAGYNVRTGEVAAMACGNRMCAETHVANALGGVRSEIRFTEAIRPRTSFEVPVCPSCEATFGTAPFPPGTFFGRGPTGGIPP